MPLVPVPIQQLARGVGIVRETQPAASHLMGMAAYTGATDFVLGEAAQLFRVGRSSRTCAVIDRGRRRPMETAFGSTGRSIPHSTRRRSSLPPSFFDLIDLIGCHSLSFHHEL